MAYVTVGIDRVTAGTIDGELRAYFGICKFEREEEVNQDDASFHFVWKERNRTIPDGIESQDNILMAKWAEEVYFYYRQDNSSGEIVSKAHLILCHAQELLYSP